MNPATIRSILEGRKKEMEKYLARFLKDQKDMRKEVHLAHAPEMLESISHQIGYMTGAIEQTKEHLRMLDVTDKEYFRQQKEAQDHNEALMKQLKNSIRRKSAKQ